MKVISNNVLITGIVSSMFIWGLSWPSGKVLTHYCSPLNLAISRYFIVVLTLLPTLLLLKTGFRVGKAGIPPILASGALLSAYTWFFFSGLKFGAPGAGGVLVTTLNPVIAYTIGIALNRRLPSKNETVGLVLGILAGLVLLNIWDKPGEVFKAGNLYYLLAAVTWAAMSKFTSRGALTGSPLSFSFWQYVVTLLCLLPMMDTHEFGAVLQIKDPYFWGNLIFSSAIVTSLATTIYFYSTTRLGAEKASSYIFMVPLAAAVSSWLFLGEHILLHTAIGGILGMMAVYIINKKTKVVAEELPL